MSKHREKGEPLYAWEESHVIDGASVKMKNGTEQLAAPKGGILVAVCSLGQVRVEWAASYAGAVCPFGVMRHTVVIKGMTTVDARNQAVANARKHELDFLMFWDDDMMPKERSGLELLYAAMLHHPKIDVISGVYPVRRAVPDPVCMESSGSGPYWGWTDGKIHPVFMTGTGFTLIRMSSLKDVPLPWFRDDGDLSDDFFFAYLCREYGLHQYVHGGVIVDQVRLDGTVFDMQDAIPDIVEPPVRAKTVISQVVPGGIGVKVAS